MAIYHLSAKVMSRGKGHSAVAAAAYRSRSSLQDERTGEIHDYSRKADEALFVGIYAPKDAPDWTRDRAQLWNHVEAFEKRRDAQLAREFEIALPHELTLEQNRYALQDWVRDNFTRKGLIADVAIHAPGQGGDQRNTHAHIMVVTRKLDGSEFAAAKERTADMAERKAELENLRTSWERIGNRHLERHGHAPTLDRRTLLAQGVDRPPTVHLGKDATALERQGVETELGEHNRTIEALQVIDLAAERERREANGNSTAATKAPAAMSDTVTPDTTNTADEQDKRNREENAKTEAAHREQNDQTEQTRRGTIQKQQDDAKRQAEAAANAHELAAQAKQMEAINNQAVVFAAYVEGVRREAEQAGRVKAYQEQQAREDAARPQDKPLFVRDAGTRYGMALAQEYNVRDPYGSLARAATTEHGAFLRDREQLTEQISKTDDPAQRQALETRKQIEHCDYMALTCNRIAVQNQIITGRSDSPDAVAQRDRAAAFQAEASGLREQVRDTRLKEQAEHATGTPEPKVFSGEAIATDPAARREMNTQLVTERQRREAIDKIDGALKTNKHMDSADFNKLRQSDLEGLRKEGAAHFKELVAEREKERSRENANDRGRERER